MAGLGKPRIKKSDGLEIIVQFRSTSDTVAAIDAACGKRGETRSEWFRRVVEDALKKSRRESPPTEPTTPT